LPRGAQRPAAVPARLSGGTELRFLAEHRSRRFEVSMLHDR
jgi:hypothetical protein